MASEAPLVEKTGKIQFIFVKETRLSIKTALLNDTHQPCTFIANKPNVKHSINLTAKRLVTFQKLSINNPGHVQAAKRQI